MFFVGKKFRSANSGAESYAVLIRDAREDELEGECCVDPRLDCSLPAWCDPVAGYGHSPWVTLVTAVSGNSLALFADRRFEPGTILVILPPHKDMPGNLPARVTRARSAGSGRWMIGCRLVFPWSEEEIRTLLDAWQLERKDLAPAY
jgi:hypothetical protein